MKPKVPYAEFADIFRYPEIVKISRPIRSSHPYRFSTDYLPRETFVDLIAMTLYHSQVAPLRDFISHHLLRQAKLFVHQNTPVYAIDRATVGLFAQSSIANRDDLFDTKSLDSGSTSYCVLLPRNSFPTVNGDFLEVLWIESAHNNSPFAVVETIAELKKETYQRTLEPGVRQVTAGGMDTDGALWCSLRLYPEDGSPPGNLGSAAPDAEDVLAIKRIAELALQVLMSIEHLPDAVEIVSASTERKGFSKATKSETIWHPRKIAVEQKRYRATERSDSEAELSRKSPRPHWRNFHWRRVATGTNRERREWRLIQRTHVNPVQEI